MKRVEDKDISGTQQTDLTVSPIEATDICYVVGFNNIANFNRRFRDIKGMTPREFRRQVESRFAGRS